MQNEFKAPDGRGDARRNRANEEDVQTLADREVPLVQVPRNKVRVISE